MEPEAVDEGYHVSNPLAIEGEQLSENTEAISDGSGTTRPLPPSRPPAPKLPPTSKPHLQSSLASAPPTQGYQGTVRQATYTVHEISENEVITKENIEEMIYARRVKDNKFLTQVLIAASVVCFWWPFSLICLAAAYYTSEKITELNDMKDYRTAKSCRIMNLVCGITAIVWAIILFLIIVIASAAS